MGRARVLRALAQADGKSPGGSGKYSMTQQLSRLVDHRVGAGVFGVAVDLRGLPPFGGSRFLRNRRRQLKLLRSDSHGYPHLLPADLLMKYPLGLPDVRLTV